MTIRELGPGPRGPNGPRRIREKEESAKGSAASGQSSVSRGDRVDISDAGRVLSSKGSLLNDMLSVQTSERLATIQRRIDSGAYDTPEMAEEVAHRLLASGDL